MARTELDRAVRPSLFDRLTDEAPREPADRQTSPAESALVYRRAVQRDVEALLNTRRAIVPVPAGCVEVRRSVHEYGIGDSTGIPVGTTEGRKRLTDDVRDALVRCEPRLTNIRVVLVEASQLNAQQVRFSIEATLLMDPSPEKVVFDTVLEVSRGTFELNGAV
jgi:type VI secretion system protein ImpF